MTTSWFYFTWNYYLDLSSFLRSNILGAYLGGGGVAEKNFFHFLQGVRPPRGILLVARSEKDGVCIAHNKRHAYIIMSTLYIAQCIG